MHKSWTNVLRGDELPCPGPGCVQKANPSTLVNRPYVFALNGYPLCVGPTGRGPGGSLPHSNVCPNSLPIEEFADESLGPSCSNDNIDLCDGPSKKILDKYNAMTAKERKAIVDKAQGQIDQAEETFKTEVKLLQEAYEKLQADKDAAVKKLQTKDLSLLKSIKSDAKDEL